MRTIQWFLAGLLVAELVTVYVLWAVLWTRYRRPDVRWYRIFERENGRLVMAWSRRHYVPASERLHTLVDRVSWAIGTTLLAILFLVAIEGNLICLRR
jgi:hypothetical protein